MDPRPEHVPDDFADPVVTGSIYCSGHLSEVLLRAMVPLRRGLRTLDHGQLSYLWCMQYSKGGQHLKVRIHGPREIELASRQLLQQVAEDCLTAIGPRPPHQDRLVRPEAVPIDEEDRSSEAPPDRSFTFTRYGRSHVSLGGEPFLSQDRYRALMTLCLARGCDQVLDALESQGEVFSHVQSQRLLLKALLSGMAALRFPPAKAEAYLAYHRDWLIRFPLLRKGGDGQEAAAAVAYLERQAEKASATVKSLRSLVESRWTGTGDSPEGSTPWGRAMADLLDYISRYRDDPSYRQDPFAEDLTYSPIFKVFHGLSNLLGFKALDKAYAYHLLLQAVAKEPSRHQHVALAPD